jgi:HK97 family phage portal protein
VVDKPVKRFRPKNIPKGEQKYHRILAQVVSPWEEETGIDAPRTYAFKDLLGVYGETDLGNVWVYRAVRAISETTAQLPLMFQRKDKDGKWITLDTAPAAKLFRDVNPVMSYYDYMEAESVYLELTGNVFLALENPSPSGGWPREIWPIRPDIVRIHPDEETGEVLGYTVHLKRGEKPILYRRDEMIHFKYFNPLNWYWGLSPLAAFKMGITFEYYTKKYENNFFKHGVRETGILVTERRLDKAQFDRLKKQVEDRYGGVDMMHRPMILEGGLDWKRISVPPKDMEYKGLKEWNKDEVQAVYNIPPIKLMDMSDASVLANAEIQERLFYTDCIIPRLRKKESYYNEFLLPFFVKKSELHLYRFKFDLSEVAIFQLDEDTKSRVAVRLTTGNNPIMSPNEVRDRFYNLPPAPWGGKEPLVPQNLMPAGFLSSGLGAAFQQEGLLDLLAEKVVSKIEERANRKKLVSLSVGNNGKFVEECVDSKRIEKIEIDNDEESEGTSSSSSSPDKYSEEYIMQIIPEFEVSEEHQQYWRDWAIKRLKEEDRFVRALNVEFRRQLQETLNNIDKLRRTDQIIPVKSLLFDEQKAIANMQELYLSHFGVVVRNASQEEFEKWGLLNPLDLDSPTVIEYGKNQASWFAGTGRENLRPGQYPGVVGTQLERLERELNEGYRNGESVAELEKRVKRVFEGTIREKGYAARRIARTETIRIANFARLTQYQRNKNIVEKKQWLSQLDARVDEVCASLHGEIADLGGSFSGGYYAPPDPHPNCRCVLLPVIKSKVVEEVKPAEDDINKLVADLEAKYGSTELARSGVITVAERKRFGELWTRIWADIDKDEIFNKLEVLPSAVVDRLLYRWAFSSGSEEGAILKDYFAKLQGTQVLYHSDVGGFLDRNKDLLRIFRKFTDKHIKKIFNGWSKEQIDRFFVHFRAVNKYLWGRVDQYKNRPIVVYRGVSIDYFTSNNLPVPPKGKSGKLFGNSIESWTANYDVALRFIGLKGVVLRVVVSIDDLAFGVTSPKLLLGEAEHVVLAGKGIEYKVIKGPVKEIGDISADNLIKDKQSEAYRDTLEWAMVNIDPEIDLLLGTTEEDVDWLKTLRE